MSPPQLPGPEAHCPPGSFEAHARLACAVAQALALPGPGVKAEGGAEAVGDARGPRGGGGSGRSGRGGGGRGGGGRGEDVCRSCRSFVGL